MLKCMRNRPRELQPGKKAVRNFESISKACVDENRKSAEE